MIIDRGYVKERMEGNTKYLLPSKLGLGLVHGYDQIGLDKCLSKPQLRREVSEMIFAVPLTHQPTDRTRDGSSLSRD